MEAFVSRKRPKLMPIVGVGKTDLPQKPSTGIEEESDCTDVKLAVLASLFPDIDQATLLDILLASDGSVEQARKVLNSSAASLPRKKPTKGVGYQTSLAAFKQTRTSFDGQSTLSTTERPLTRKGQTLHLYTPEHVEKHTPCSIIHNFLPAEVANELLKELLIEAPTFERQTFKLFDNVVQSPHSACFYVESSVEQEVQKKEYLYNGSYLNDIRQITPQMRKVSMPIKEAVNREISRRIQLHYPDGKKLSLGVTREFRVRKIVAREEAAAETKVNSPSKSDRERADMEGQVAIHLPHNSLLVMHAEMQEEFKHSIHPAPVIDPHPIAGNKRINKEEGE
ncbi:MAG: hypothetical protein Q9207_000647 [Kuettlingeria erythrocarpa]